MKKILSILLVLVLILAALPAMAEPVSEVMQVTGVTSYVSMRESPDTSSNRLEKVRLGEFVTSCTAASNGFVHCYFEGKSGYVLAKYLKTTSYTGWDTLLRNQQVVNCEEWVSLRKSADSTSERLVKVPKGAIVTGCVQSGSFIKCTYNGKTGYIMSKYLNTADYSGSGSGSGSTVKTSAIMQVANCTNWVSLRKTASTSAERISPVHLGELVKVVGTSGEFVKCTYNGKTGYILAAYLKTTSISSSATILPNQKITTLYGGNVALRASASTSSARLDSIPTGAIVTACVKENSGWVKCVYNGQTGYVYAKYLKNAY